MEKTLLLKGVKAIVTCDAEDRVYRGADLLVRGGRIESIAVPQAGAGAGDCAVPQAGAGIADTGVPQAGADIAGRSEVAADEVIDGSRYIVYPGLVNTHHHFFQTFVRNLIRVDFVNVTLAEWLDEIYRIFAHIDGDVIYYSSLTAMADLVKHGCTTAFDHQYCFTTATGKTPIDRQFAAAREIGIRYHAGRGTNTLPRSEGSTMPDEMVESTQEFLDDCARVIGLYHNPDPLSYAQIVMAPCQPINCYRDTFTETVRMAREAGVRMHTHLCEGENDIMLERWGKRTLAWAEEAGFIGDDVWYAHGWDLLPEEYAVMGRTGTGVSHCPTPAILGGSPILPMQQMQRAGINISLGCDGSATNDSSNLLDALRTGWLMQAWHSKARGGCISPYEMLKIATVNGAKTLGRTDIGYLAPGMAADFFLIDADTLELTATAHDAKNLLARTGVTGPVAMTFIGGKAVYADGKIAGIDERALAAEGAEVLARVLSGKCAAYQNLD
ncbi:MAG: amidohydrolase family protein [Clostridiales Family XIII bacterium]|jgi:hydroxyatrazine ethylaminohydrolase|nr:amidohydrolase family protein [Clostridiales Family XIII bacterium]